MRTFAVVLEQTESGYSAYVPELPGCVAAGDTRDETLELMRGAIELHLEDEDPDATVPPPPEVLALVV
jgi:predicted RNase H-like HicB family nuclease